MTLQAEHIDALLGPEPERVTLPEIPDLSEHTPISHSELRYGMRVLAHRVVVDRVTREVVSIPAGFLIIGRVTSVPTRQDPRQFVTVDERPDRQPLTPGGIVTRQGPSLVPLHDVRDGELIKPHDEDFFDEKGDFFTKYVVMMQFYRDADDTDKERAAWVAGQVRQKRELGSFSLGAHDG